MTLSRRHLLSTLGASLPLLGLPGFVQAAGTAPPSGNILILIELAGGNDGLNTVVPFTDPDYRGLRPQIGLDRESLLTLDRNTGLHGDMRAVADMWEDGDLRVIEGVGYPDPSRSHFRSIEIWNTGFGADSATNRGWVSTAFDSVGVPRSADTEGLVLGGGMGPLNGEGRFSAMRDTDGFIDAMEALPGMAHRVRPAQTSPIDHVLAAYDSAKATGDIIRQRLESSAARHWDFPGSGIGQQLRVAARLIDAGVEVPTLKVVQDGYDTHDNQPGQHAYLMMELSDAIGAFARAMKEAGVWNQITIVTFSEFGRTARENASYGTDHGTAAPVFVMGGNVSGGFAGARPRLDRLVEDDLTYTTDYRALYHAILQDLWRIDAPAFAGHGPRLRLLSRT